MGIFRHPCAVANSLAARRHASVTVEKGLELWRIYNECLVKLHQSRSFPLLNFEAERKDFLAQFSCLCKAIDLTPDFDRMQSFYESQYIRHAPRESKLSNDIIRLHEYLQDNQNLFLYKFFY